MSTSIIAERPSPTIAGPLIFPLVIHCVTRPGVTPRSSAKVDFLTRAGGTGLFSGWNGDFSPTLVHKIHCDYRLYGASRPWTARGAGKDPQGGYCRRMGPLWRYVERQRGHMGSVNVHGPLLRAYYLRPVL